MHLISSVYSSMLVVLIANRVLSSSFRIRLLSLYGESRGAVRKKGCSSRAHALRGLKERELAAVLSFWEIWLDIPSCCKTVWTWRGLTHTSPLRAFDHIQISSIRLDSRWKTGLVNDALKPIVWPPVNIPDLNDEIPWLVLWFSTREAVLQASMVCHILAEQLFSPKFLPLVRESQGLVLWLAICKIEENGINLLPLAHGIQPPIFAP